jgi:hypothetical protein
VRTLHRIAAHERLIAQGTYTVLPGERPALHERETWQLHRMPDQSELLRIDRQTGTHPQAVVVTEVWRSAPSDGYRIQRIDRLSCASVDCASTELRISITLGEDYAGMGWATKEQSRQYAEVAISGDQHFFDGSWILLSQLVAKRANSACLTLLTEDGQPPTLESRQARVHPGVDAITVSLGPSEAWLVTMNAHGYADLLRSPQGDAVVLSNHLVRQL